MLKAFDRYVLREIVPPFFIGLVLYTFVLLMNQILLLAELLIAHGVSFGVAVLVLVLLIPSILAFAVPMSVIMGILAGLSRMSSDSEIVAFKTLGISYKRLLWPIFVFAIGGWLLTSILAIWIAPRANYRWVKTVTGSVLARVELRFNPREFNESIPNMVLYIQDIGSDREWRNVFIYSTKTPDEPAVIMARRGRIELFAETKTASIELLDGTIYAHSTANPEKFTITTFRRNVEEVDVSGLFATFSGVKRVREKDLGELWRDLKAIRAEAGARSPAVKTPSADAPGGRAREALRRTREERAHWVEIHKKFALPFVCFIFILLGVPLGATTRKGGRTSGFTISIGIILLYYVLITAGEKMAMDGRISPFLGMWGPNLILAAAGVYLFAHALRETSPLPALAAFFRLKPRAAGKPAEGMEARRRPRLHLPFPNILDRYAARRYLFIFSLVFLGLVSVSIIVTFFERIDNVYAHDKPLSLLFLYIWYRIPDFISYIIPVAALTTTLLSLGIMTKFNEVTAMKACGISVYRMIVPVLVLAVILSAAAFSLQEKILPFTNIKSAEVWNRINDLPPRSYSYINRHWVLGRKKDRIFHYDFFDPVPAIFSRLRLFDLDLESWSLRRQAFAEKAYLGEGRLGLIKAWIRRFEAGRPVSFEPARQVDLPETERKGDFLETWKEPAQMTYLELRDYAAEVESMGFEATRFKVDLSTKLSFPLIGLIMTLLGIPFAFSMGKKGTLVGLGLSVVIAMVYWGTIGVFRSLGYVSFLSPFLSAWGPNLLFGLAGVYLLFRLRT